MESKMETNIAAPQSLSQSLTTSFEAPDRNWMPMVIAAVVVIAVLGMVLVLSRRAKQSQDSGASSSATDAYAASLPITGLAMSESSNLAGGKVTYLDGHIANQGNRTVVGAVALVTFRDYKREVAQSQRMALTVVRMKEPYIDTVSMSAAPLKPGEQKDFRLNFDQVSPDWSGSLPEVRIVRTDLK
jgi:hypothetical protein